MGGGAAKCFLFCIQGNGLFFLGIWVVNNGVNVWFGLLGVLYKSLLKLFKLIGFGLGEETKI